MLNRIIFDGHDGSGKTTWALMTAEYLKGFTNARYVKPYNGSLGDLIAWLFEQNRIDLLNSLALAAIQKIENENSDASVLVYDRHWLSIFTLLTEDRYFQMWGALPKTFVCWTTPEITEQRLMLRSVEETTKWDSSYYCKVYRELGMRFAAKLIDTSDIQPENVDFDAVNKLLSGSEFDYSMS